MRTNTFLHNYYPGKEVTPFITSKLSINSFPNVLFASRIKRDYLRTTIGGALGVVDGDPIAQWSSVLGDFSWQQALAGAPRYNATERAISYSGTGNSFFRIGASTNPFFAEPLVTGRFSVCRVIKPTDWMTKSGSDFSCVFHHWTGGTNTSGITIDYAPSFSGFVFTVNANTGRIEEFSTPFVPDDETRLTLWYQGDGETLRFYLNNPVTPIVEEPYEPPGVANGTALASVARFPNSFNGQGGGRWAGFDYGTVLDREPWDVAGRQFWQNWILNHREGDGLVCR